MPRQADTFQDRRQKLTDADVVEARALHAAGKPNTVSSLARQYGVHRVQMDRIIRRVSRASI
jgi:transposase-like protein